MAIFGIFDIAIGGILIGGLIAVAIQLRPGRVIAGQNGGPATARRSTGAVVVLCTFGAALVLIVLFNVAYFNGFGTDPVIGSLTRAQVTGTWAGNHGATLVLRPDGTFTASGLPPYVAVASGDQPGDPVPCPDGSPRMSS